MPTHLMTSSAILKDTTDVLDFGIMDLTTDSPDANVEIHSYPRLVYYPVNSVKPMSVQGHELFGLVKGVIQVETGRILGKEGEQV